MNSRQMIFVGLSVFVGVYFVMRGFDLLQVYYGMEEKVAFFRFLVFTISVPQTQQSVPLLSSLLIGLGILIIVTPFIFIYKKQKTFKHEPHKETTS